VLALFGEAGVDVSDSEADATFERYLRHYRSHWRLYPDALQCLERLAGRRLGIISNGHADAQRMKLEHTGIADRFGPVAISGDIGVAKPHPAIFRHARALADVPAERCIYVGDRLETDALAAEAAGMRGIFLDRDHGSPTTRVPRIGSLEELPDLLESF
jgi:putative hydrolase of the HAD superfamily